LYIKRYITSINNETYYIFLSPRNKNLYVRIIFRRPAAGHAIEHNNRGRTNQIFSTTSTTTTLTTIATYNYRSVANSGSSSSYAIVLVKDSRRIVIIIAVCWLTQTESILRTTTIHVAFPRCIYPASKNDSRRDYYKCLLIVYVIASSPLNWFSSYAPKSIHSPHSLTHALYTINY